MGMELKKTIVAADHRAQYDECVKKLLSHKEILAHILVHTVDEFKGMNPKDVIDYIEGEPYVGVVPVDSGQTNTDVKDPETGEMVKGLNTEDTEIKEGMARFDIIFYVRMRDGISQIIVNVEAQKQNPSEYKIVNRAQFYVCRMISSQQGRDFQKSNYDDIKRVISIWVCMNIPENTLDFYRMTNEKVLGSYDWGGKLDMLNIVVIGLAKEIPEHDEKYELHRLLSVLLSPEMEPMKKCEIIENEYRIQVEDEVREEMNIMCNLGEGLWEEAHAEGLATGHAAGRIETLTNQVRKKLQKGKSLSVIAEECEEDESVIQEIIASIDEEKS